jgi:hypothetical protein
MEKEHEKWHRSVHTPNIAMGYRFCLVTTNALLLTLAFSASDLLTVSNTALLVHHNRVSVVDVNNRYPSRINFSNKNGRNFQPFDSWPLRLNKTIMNIWTETDYTSDWNLVNFWDGGGSVHKIHIYTLDQPDCSLMHKFLVLPGHEGWLAKSPPKN